MEGGAAVARSRGRKREREAEMGSRRHACACVWASDMIPAVKRRTMVRTRAGGSNGSILRGPDRQLDRRDIDRHDRIGGKRERNRNDKENEMTRRNEMRGEMR
jgi:hypothetical protein